MIPIGTIIRIQAADRRDAQRIGLTVPSYHLLCLIAYDEAQSLTQLAAKMGITSGSLSSLADTLEKRGFARRRRQGGYRRADSMQITTEGENAMLKIHDNHSAA
jgi:DNA-binding MarR family transcriptional regulator